MLRVAIINKGVVVNLAAFANEEDVKNFNFEDTPAGEGSYGVIVIEGTFVDIGFFYDGENFIAPPAPEPTKEELVQAAANQRQALINSANQVFVSWQTKLLLNRATEDEKKSLNEWLDYFEALQILDISKAPDITWPKQPTIPEGGQ